jgi:glutamate carboxypeptidase
MSSTMNELLRWLRPQKQRMVALLGRLVRAESPSFDKAAVDRCGNLLAAEWRKRGAKVEYLRQPERGDHLRCELWLGRGKPQGQILLLGHFDTVYGLGTLRRMPFQVRGGKAFGPGTFDMKGGLVQALFAVDALRACPAVAGQLRKRIVCLWNTDEEIGSASSRVAIEREARRSDAVLVLEPATAPDGKLKTGRKGVGEVEITVHGRAAHAGLEPAKGVNAVHELALQIERIARWNNPRRGITVNVDVVAGGSRANVIAERARAVVDVRVARLADAHAMNLKFLRLRPILSGARIEIHGGVTRPPLERKVTAELFRLAQRLGREIGLELEESFVGGGSDGNWTAALGIPTLDGLGAVGDGAHAAHEHILTRTMPRRAALLAGLISSL